MQIDPIYFRGVAGIQRSILANTSYGIYQQLRNPGVLFASRGRSEGRLSVAPVRVCRWDVDIHMQQLGPRPLASAVSRRAGLATCSAGPFSKRTYAIAAAQLGISQPPRVNSGGFAAWVYSSAADVTSSCGTWTEEKEE